MVKKCGPSEIHRQISGVNFKVTTFKESKKSNQRTTIRKTVQWDCASPRQCNTSPTLRPRNCGNIHHTVQTYKWFSSDERRSCQRKLSSSSFFFIFSFIKNDERVKNVVKYIWLKLDEILSAEALTNVCHVIINVWIVLATTYFEK